MSNSSRKQEHMDIVEALTDALFDLMNKKTIDDISVLELITKAGIARGTYYNNYDSKEDIIVSFLDRVIDDFKNKYPVSCIDDLYSHKHQRDLFYFIVRHTKSIDILKKSHMDYLFLERLNHYLLNTGLNHCLDDEIRLMSLAGMEYNLIFNWYQKDKERIIEQMDYALKNNVKYDV